MARISGHIKKNMYITSGYSLMKLIKRFFLEQNAIEKRNSFLT